MRRLPLLALVALAVLAGPAAAGGADEIGFVEDYVFAEDKAKAIQQLVPGTEEHFFYQCLRHQTAGELDEVDAIIKRWLAKNRNRRTPLLRQMEHRQALLRYRRDADGTLGYLRGDLGLHFNHQRKVARKSKLPTRLDPKQISRETLTRRALASHSRLGGFEPEALQWLIDRDLSPRERRHLLERLDRPDHAKLVKLIHADLGEKDSRGFGSLGIHKKLLRSQLDELLKLRPKLIRESNFVHTYIARLRPDEDTDWRKDPRAELAYLNRMWAFVEDLDPVFNSLKAHVLAHRLRFDRARGVYDADLFMEYVKLPRRVWWMRDEYVKAPSRRGHITNDSRDFRKVTRLPVPAPPEGIVRAYLEHFFVKADDYDSYTKVLSDTYLKQVFAETKLLAGVGKAEKWAAMLSPSAYKALKDRVELNFAPTNPEVFPSDEKVQLDLDVKNVEQLIVKVYRINAEKYYRQLARPVQMSLDLDGLVANSRRTHRYDEPPVRRVRRRFEFPELAGRGIYVIEFIGSGQRSRALIRKGRLDCLVRTGPAGQRFAILDESGKKVRGANLWVAGHVYEADEDGTITVPFTNKPTRQEVVITHAGAASLASFGHQAEQYSLTCGFHVDREALLKRRDATVLIRPQLRLNGTPMSLDLLEEVRLTVTVLDLDGVSTTRRVEDFKLFEDREATHTFRVPDRLRQVTFRLAAKVKNLSKDSKQSLAASRAFRLNAIDETPRVAGLNLVRAAGGWTLEMRGRNGEPLADRPVAITLKHREFTSAVHVALKTNDAGRIELGGLEGIERVETAYGEKNKVRRAWRPARDEHNLPSVLHGRAGGALALPYMGSANKPLREEFSLLEVRDGAFVADRFDALRLAGGMLELRGLAAGDYSLLLKREGKAVHVRITEGEPVDGFITSRGGRWLEVRDDKPVQIVSAKADGEKVTVRLANVTDLTRVHVLAARYVPEYRVYPGLHPFGWLAPLAARTERAESEYAAGRRISDEYRYILDRRYAEKLPGNMLKRPSLLLNPWSPRKADTGTAVGKGGQRFAGRGGAATEAPESAFFGRGADKQAGGENTLNLDFLDHAAVVRVNLRPDENGVVTIPLADLKGKQHVRILAADAEHTAMRMLTLERGEPALRDLRLTDPLDPQRHYTQQKSISTVAKGGKLVLADLTTAEFETFDSLAKVYRLFATLNRDQTLAEFAFVLRWPDMDEAEKREKYTKYACHELHFFLHQKDPAFFRKVVLPYLKNKKDKTFLDDWLVGNDLGEYLKPWRYERLNVVERVLLGRRVREERAAAERHVRDLFDLLTPDVDRFNKLFDTALGLGRMDVSAGERLQRLRQLARKEGEEVDADMDRVALGTVANEPRPEGKAEALAALRTRLRKSDKKAPAKPAATPPPPAAPRPAAAKAKARGRAAEAGEARREEAAKAYDARRAARDKARQFYRKVGQVREWVENNYYHLPVERQNASLVPVNAFWRDYAAWDGKGGFLSTNLAEAGRNFPEMMFALAVLDLPFKAGEHETEMDGTALTLTPAHGVVVFHEEISEAKDVPKVRPILVSQNLYRLGQRYKQVDGEKVDNFVTDEFLVGEVYGCHVVVTNPTSTRRKLQVLMQVPAGSLPVSKGKATRTFHIVLEPYRTQTFDSFFYFPAAGEFGHYPVHVARRGELLAFAEPTSLKAVNELTKVDKASWEYVSQHGTEKEVLAFLRDNNVQRLDLDLIAWRMKDKGFFQTVVGLLEARHEYNHTLWSYAIHHNVPAVAREFLKHCDSFVARCGPTLDSPLLTIDPVVRRIYQHVEYWPLVNARAHVFGERRKILVDRFRGQYHALLNILRYRAELGDKDRLDLACYLLLQDRVTEAKAYFARVQPDNLPTRLPYDYFTAYLDLYEPDPDVARELAAKYADYPVERWRKLFAAVGAQIDEIEGKAPKVVDDKDRGEKQTKLAATETALDFTVEAREITLNYQNLDSATVNFYMMDIELMFSRQPFVKDRGGQFAYIQPNHVRQVKLPAGKAALTVPLPKELHNRNVMVEVVAGGKTRAEAYYSHSLVVQMMENYGQLRVTTQEGGRPVPAAYVKVYARLKNGAMAFYKDGYTDLRGRFDYTSLNTDGLDAVDKFSVLVLTDKHGSTVKEAAPPKR